MFRSINRKPGAVPADLSEISRSAVSQVYEGYRCSAIRTRFTSNEDKCGSPTFHLWPFSLCPLPTFFFLSRFRFLSLTLSFTFSFFRSLEMPNSEFDSYCDRSHDRSLFKTQSLLKYIYYIYNWWFSYKYSTAVNEISLKGVNCNDFARTAN